jgi:hypothetical protein
MSRGLKKERRRRLAGVSHPVRVAWMMPLSIKFVKHLSHGKTRRYHASEMTEPPGKISDDASFSTHLAGS